MVSLLSIILRLTFHKVLNNYKIACVNSPNEKKTPVLKKGGLFVSTYLRRKINLQCGQKQEKCVKKWKVFHILGESSLCVCHYFQENTETFSCLLN